MKIITLNKIAHKSFEKGLIYLYKDIYKAIYYLTKACDIENYNSEYKFNLALAYAYINNYEESNKILKKVMFWNPNITTCYFMLGCNYSCMGENLDAFLNLKKYIKLDENGSYVKEANELINIISLDENMEHINEYVNEPNYLNLTHDIKKFIKHNQYKEAIECLEKILMNKPLNLSARNILSLLYFYERRLDEAIAMANSVLKIDSKDMHASRNLAVYYYTLKFSNSKVN
jgi:tetratricopeptide (TPR) repeat protein